MRIKMIKTRNYVVPTDRRQTVKYLEGKDYTVKREWGNEMVSAREAREVKSHSRAKPAPDSPAADVN